MVQKIDHVVIAVNDLNEGMAQYEKTLGLKPSRTGERSADGFKSAFYDLPGGIKVFAGPRDDPFFIDLAAVFDRLELRPLGLFGDPPQGRVVDVLRGGDWGDVVIRDGRGSGRTIGAGSCCGDRADSASGDEFPACDHRRSPTRDTIP